MGQTPPRKVARSSSPVQPAVICASPGTPEGLAGHNCSFNHQSGPWHGSPRVRCEEAKTEWLGNLEQATHFSQSTQKKSRTYCMLKTVLGTADPTEEDRGGPAWGLMWWCGSQRSKHEGKSRTQQKVGHAQVVNKAGGGCWGRGGGFYVCIQWPPWGATQ